MRDPRGRFSPRWDSNGAEEAKGRAVTFGRRLQLLGMGPPAAGRDHSTFLPILPGSSRWRPRSTSSQKDAAYVGRRRRPSGSAALRRQDTSCGDNASQPGALRSDSRRCCGCWSPASGWPGCWFSTPYRCTPAPRTRPRLLATTRSSATRRGRAPWGSPERVARAPDRGFDDGCRYQCICPPPRTPSYAQPARVLGDRVKAAAGLPGGFQGRDQPAFATAGPPRTRDSDRSCVPRQRRWASAAHR